MKLLLTSSGLTNKSIADALFELVGKRPSDTTIAFIPTAMNVEKVDKGAEVKVGGGRPEGLQGAYYKPTVLTNITKDMKVWNEEVFGPLYCQLFHLLLRRRLLNWPMIQSTA